MEDSLESSRNTHKQFAYNLLYRAWPIRFFYFIFFFLLLFSFLLSGFQENLATRVCLIFYYQQVVWYEKWQKNKVFSIILPAVMSATTNKLQNTHSSFCGLAEMDARLWLVNVQVATHLFRHFLVKNMSLQLIDLEFKCANIPLTVSTNCVLQVF